MEKKEVLPSFIRSRVVRCRFEASLKVWLRVRVCSRVPRHN